MPFPTLSQAWFWVFTVISAGVGAFLGAYLKEKAKHLATKEDFTDLKDQTRQLTETTKEIESKIDDQVWNRQRQWEMKRDALVEGARAANDLLSAVTAVDSAYLVDEKPNDIAFNSQLLNHQTELMRALNEASRDFQRSVVLVGVVSAIETQTAFVAMEKILKDTGLKIVNGDRTIFKQRQPLIKTTAVEITNAIRKELKIEVPDLEITPQSSESVK